RYEFRVVTKDGQVRWVEISATLFSKNGQFLSQAICRDITERKLAEERLFKSEKKFSSIFHLTPHSMAISDITTGKFIDINQSFTYWSGYAREEVIGVSARDLHLWVHPGDREKIIKTLATADEINGEEVMIRRKNGNVRNVIFSARFIEIDGKRYLLTLAIDITDRKQAEENLAKSEKKFSSIFHLNSNPMVISDIVTGEIIDVNQAYINWTGYSCEEIMGSTGKTLHLWINSSDRKKIIDKLKAEGEVNSEEILAKQKNGNVRNMLISARFIEIGQKLYVLMFGHDITERKRAEEALWNSHRRLEDIIDFLPDATLAIDREGKVVAWNRSMERMSKVSKADMIGRKNYEYALPFYGERRPILIDLVMLPDNVFEYSHYENVYRQGDTLFAEAYVPQAYGGKGAFMWGTASRLRNASGNIIGAIESFRDITNHRRMEDEIRKSENKYRTLFESANDIIFLMDQDIFIDCNQKTLEMFCCTKEQIIGQPPYRFSPKIQPDGRNSKEKALEKINAVIKGQPQFFEWKFCRYDGSYFDAEVSLNSFKDKNKYYIQAIVRDITDRRRVEDALEKSETKYRNIFENAMEGIYQTTMEGRFITANTAFAHMAGYNSSEELIESVQDIATQLYVHPEDRQRVLEIGAKKGFAKSVEVEFYKKNGSIFWVEINARIVRNEQGDILYIEGFIQDITIRKQVQEILSKSERKFASLFKLNPDSMTISEIATGKYIDVNEAFTSWTGYSREEVIGVSDKNLRLWVNSGDREKIIRTLSTVAEEVNGIEILMRHKNGHIRNVLFSARFIEIDQERYLFTLGHDITDRKQMENALKEAELKFRTIFESASQGIILTLSRERKFLDINPKMCEMLGYTKDELLKMDISDIHPEDCLSHIINNYEKLKNKQILIALGIPFLRKDKTVFFADVTAASMIIKGKECLCGMFRDITDRKRSEEEIERTHEQMRAFATQLQTVREEERTRIAREIHDELGGALTGIKIDFSLLKKAAAEIKEKVLKDRLFDQMHSTTKLIDKTIGTVRKISTELRPGILDDLGILAALEWQLDDFRKRTNTHCKWISSLENINLEEQETTAMFRIFQETLINVARHAGATEVKVQLRKKENAYFLEIADNGKGITKKNIDDKRSLGLLGMRERALAVGGRINIKGHPGKGTKVTVEIPIRQTGKNKTTEEGNAQ
ncbi:MAG: PAS domain S-box protein, partial [Smithella sp.]